MQLKQMLLLSFLVPASGMLLADTSTSDKNGKQNNQNPPMEQQITPAVNPEAKNSYGIFVSADALLWSFSEGGNCYAVNSNNNANEQDGATLKTASSKDKTNWSWGSRVGLGYRTPYDGWDLYADWTHFDVRRHSSTSQSPSGDGGIFPGFDRQHADPDVATAYANRAHSRWRCHLDVIDFELGRNFLVSPKLSLRPHVGLRGAIITQKVKSHFSGGNWAVPAFDNSNRNNFYGVGLRSGVNSDWRLGWGFSVYADAAFALLYGHFNIHQRSTQDTDPDINLLKEHSKENMDIAAMDLALGFRYDVTSSEERVHFYISLGWEQHIYWGVNRWSHRDIGDVTVNLDTRVITNNDNLTMRGITLSTGLEF